ncbi:LacI family DNA-binding transcriptional regulator [Pseudoponticoccus marisrubri]|uniref:LacI family transcriptional regulator n=1 Tax=Pseudoponticoccus marisrubri TaxID=1685382 RepID=A0A0W7WJY7_9RHOB|nr:LacI family DNA-binding transcriptional regulator [Pseudoponticoccus marisrubri]KUF10838.1 LacI family transcriptional regulator [Pseudoponticoccus marisrubri]
MASIYDVARRAGVSTKTVSRVLNGDAPVAQKTRDAVERAMAELEYIPSFAARSMKSQKSGLIGLITGAISTAADAPADAGLPEIHIVQGAQNVFETSGKTLLISDTGGKSERVPHLIRTFRQHRVEGLLYVADHYKRVDLDLPEGAMKVVLVNCIDARGTPAVVPDDESGQLALTRRVIAAGHRRIAYLTLGRAVLATEARVAGYRQALDEAGIAFDPALVAASELFGTKGEHQMIWDALDRLLTGANPPTAICCGNDRLAMAVYGILRDRGVSVPDQISVVGYDDHRLVSETLYPALTTAELPYNAMGARAADLLLNMIAQPDSETPTQPIAVRGQVVERASLKAPPLAGTVYQLKGRREP